MNRRDEQIAEIKSDVRELRRDRLEQCYRQILEAYQTASIVDDLARVIELEDRIPSDFRVLTNSEARLLEHFNSDSHYWDYYCKELGRSISLAEKRYIFEQLAETPTGGDPIDAGNPNFTSISQAVTELHARGYRPRVLAAPISLFVPFNTTMSIDWDAGRPEVVVLPDGSRLKVFWSSHSVPLNRFVVFDPDAVTWRVKLDPDTGRLTVAIGRPRTPPRAVTFLAETVVKYDISDPAGLYGIDILEEPPPDAEVEVIQAEGE